MRGMAIDGGIYWEMVGGYKWGDGMILIGIWRGIWMDVDIDGWGICIGMGYGCVY